MNLHQAPAPQQPPAQGRGLLRPAILLAAAVSAAALLFAPAAQADLQVCTPGANAGQCKDPKGLATDFETGLLYVADQGNNRVDVFKSEGKEQGSPSSFAAGSSPAFIAVDNEATSASFHDVYVSSGFKVKRFEANGTPAGEFGEQGDGTPEGCQLERANDPIAVGPNGDVYLADSYNTTPGNPELSSVWANRLVKLDEAGACIGAVTLFEEGRKFINDLAVDSEGNVYVTVEGAGGVIRDYDGATGTLVREFELRETAGLAVDENDHLFAEQRGAQVTKSGSTHFFTEYAPSAAGSAILRRFGYAASTIKGSPTLAALPSATGDLFEGSSSGVRYFKDTPGPVAFPEACKVKENQPGSVRATLQAEVNPEGKATSISFEYMTQKEFEDEGNQFKNAHSSPEVPLEDKGATVTDFEMHEAAQSVEPLQAETTYHCRVVAKNADNPAGVRGPEGTFKTGGPFEFGSAWSSEVGDTTATINAEGNPNGAPATAQVEYVTDASYQASGFAEALRAPTPPLEYGAGEGTMVLREAALTDLIPGTLYHYRLRAFNAEFPAGIVCPEQKPSCPGLEHTFHTPVLPEAIPDDRGYELVSPGRKNSADVAVPGSSLTGFFENNRAIATQASSPNGETATYTSWTSFGNAEGAPATSQYLSHRTPAGWVTDGVSPRGFQANIFVPPYLGFSPDLRLGAIQVTEPSLAPQCPEGFEDFYLREADSGAYRCLTPEPPHGVTRKFGYCFIYGGASEDGSRVFFRASVAYANAPAGSGAQASEFSLYEWHEGKLSVVSVLPGESEPTAPTPATTFGANTGHATTNESCQTGLTFLRHAISADGSKAIWTYVPSDEAEPTQLLDRIDGTETVQLDKVQSGGGKSGGGLFWVASDDGSVVYFTDPNRLISGVKAEPGAPDLYRYDFSKPLGSRLTDLSKGLVAGNVKGVLGASDDGSVVYFAAGAALTPESETNQGGQFAKEGQNNLYVYDAAEGKVRFVASLSNVDSLDWDEQPKGITARVSPDGEHLAFLSVQSKALVGYDNLLAAKEGKYAEGEPCAPGGNLCPEAFIYDKQAKTITCASCNPAGSRPLGPTKLPGWTNMAEGPRFLSDDGTRLFFEGFDRLLPGDENDLRDVYEFELAGTGSCDASNPNYDPAVNGCHFLVSGGRSSDESFLVDASSSGRDAFFSTRAALNGWDENENFDVYDYREGGGFAEPPQQNACEGEAACTPPVPPPPAAPTPATPAFNGPGNPTPKKSSSKHGKKHHKHSRKRGKAKKHEQSKNGRAGR